MAEALCKLIEIRLTGDGLAGVIECPPAIQPTAGQYLLGHIPELEEILSFPLFPAGIDPPGVSAAMQIAPALPAGWGIGMSVQVRGPFGRGFHLPERARSVALAAVDTDLHRLMPLIGQSLAQGASVAVYTSEPPNHFPPSVEVLPLAVLPESLSWADYFALDFPLERVDEWRSLFGLSPEERCPCRGEVLVRTAMPCGGQALCGVCSLRTRRGWMYVCRDGPVFDLKDLEV